MAVPVGGRSGGQPVGRSAQMNEVPAVAEVEGAQDQSEQPTAGPTDCPSDRVNILLVDDQPANLVALEAMLQGLGQNLIRADSGREALKSLLTHDFAVILLDVKMPDMDGFETAA